MKSAFKEATQEDLQSLISKLLSDAPNEIGYGICEWTGFPLCAFEYDRQLWAGSIDDDCGLYTLGNLETAALALVRDEEGDGAFDTPEHAQFFAAEVFRQAVSAGYNALLRACSERFIKP
ncbi:hypothetical protein [Paraburkholderia caribensis]|uniref:hypothetical protein n=1 Tax=Paraburkholderia caribensis TaxID=75105 RepID=UPI001CAF7BC8|nr:hypothetical protein [Paraburkholderia caribensis]CAG9250021.1 hypothetical protein PCAR4_260104 [Paraburkholderia caribensis]